MGYRWATNRVCSGIVWCVNIVGDGDMTVHVQPTGLVSLKV